MFCTFTFNRELRPFLERFDCIEVHRGCWGFHMGLFSLESRVLLQGLSNVQDLKDFEVLDIDYHPSVPDGYLAARCSHTSYCIMGRPSPYMVVAGHSDAVGMESINSGNVGYYNSMMSAAWSHCGSSSCVIITNPKGFRTQSRFHIHYRHQSGYGKSLKAKMEHKVCKADGWHHGDFPCGGKAKLFTGQQVQRCYNVDPCWIMLSHVKPRWNMLNNVEQCWTMLNNVEPCWTMLNHVAPCWNMLNNVEQCWTMLSHVEPCSNTLNHVKPRWNMLNNVEQCWTMLSLVEPCWTMLHHVETCWTMLNNAEPCWAMLNRVQTRWTMLNNAEPRWNMLNNVEPCWTMLSHVKPCWTMLHHFETCWTLLNNAEPCWAMLNHAEPCCAILSRVEQC